MAGAGFEQARGQFEDKRLARSGFADEDLGLAGTNVEADSTQNIAFVKAEAHVFKGNDWLVRAAFIPESG